MLSIYPSEQLFRTTCFQSAEGAQYTSLGCKAQVNGRADGLPFCRRPEWSAKRNDRIAFFSPGTHARWRKGMGHVAGQYFGKIVFRKSSVPVCKRAIRSLPASRSAPAFGRRSCLRPTLSQAFLRSFSYPQFCVGMMETIPKSLSS